jgi:hypothetical protein
MKRRRTKLASTQMVELFTALRSTLIDDIFGAGDAPACEVCPYPPAGGGDSVSPTLGRAMGKQSLVFDHRQHDDLRTAAALYEDGLVAFDHPAQ